MPCCPAALLPCCQRARANTRDLPVVHLLCSSVFLVSIIIFEAGSAICGAAPNSPVFIVGRAIAGIGSAGIFAGCMLIMIPMIPLHRRPMFQGLFGMVFGIASVMGPLIGGGLTNGATWRWCFYINLPIGAVVFLFMVVWWRPAAQSFDAAGTSLNHLRRLDPLGLLFLLPSVICLLLALQWGGGDYAWGDWRIILLFVLFAVLLAAFAAVQTLKPDTATIPPRIILQRSIACGSAFTFFLAGSMLMLVYYVPIWFQTVLSVDPLKSGIYTLPLVLSLVVSSILSGIMTGRIGYYVPSMLLSPSLMSVGEGLMSTWGAATPESRWIAYQFLAGFGLGFGMQTSGLAVQTVLPPADIPTGIAINFFVQQLGGAGKSCVPTPSLRGGRKANPGLSLSAVFTAVGQAILTNLLAQRLADIPGFDPGSIVNQGATKLGATVPAQFHPQVVDAYNYACQRIFLVAMGLAFASLLCALGMEWRSIKKGRQGGGPPGAAAAAGRRDGGARAAPPEKLAPAPEAAAAADGGSAALAGDRLAEKSQAADSSSGEETSVEDTPSELPTDNEGRKRGVVAEEKEAEEALKMRGEGA